METVSIQHSTLIQHLELTLNLSYHLLPACLYIFSHSKNVQSFYIKVHSRPRGQKLCYTSLFFVSTVKYIWAIFWHKTSVNLTPPNWTLLSAGIFHSINFTPRPSLPSPVTSLSIWTQFDRANILNKSRVPKVHAFPFSLSGQKCGNWARELWQKRIETKSYRECIVRKIKGFITEFNLLFICKNATVVGKCIPWSFWIIKSRDFHRGVDC